MQRTSVVVAVALAVSAPAWAQQPRFVPIDLSSKANQKLADNQGRGLEGNDLKAVPAGDQTFADIKFRVGSGLIQLGSKLLEKFPDKVSEIPVGRHAEQLHFFHATCFGGGLNLPGSPGYVEDGTLIGEYHVRYDDKSTEVIAIVYGEDVRDWFYMDGEKEPSKGKVAWQGTNELATQYGAKLRLYVSSWKNPKPGQRVHSIDYVSRKDETPGAPFCLAITVEQK